MAKIILNVELNSDKVPSGIKKIRSEIASLGQEFGKIKNAKDVTDGVKALTEHYEKLAKAASKVVDAEKKQALADEKVRTQRAKTTAAVKEANDKHAQSLEKLNALQAKTTQEEVKAEQQKTKLTAQTIKLLDAEKKLNGELEAEKANIKDVEKETVNWSEKLKEAQAQIDQVFGRAAIRVWRLWYREVKKIFDDVNETLTKTEETVIELQRVLNDTVSDRQISNALYQLAQQYGQTFENASIIAQNFAKSGMSWNDTIKATESALLAMNVAELNASESSEGLLSIMVQFKKDASELETIVDQLNKTADKNPVTTEKLLKALQRTGSAAATSNLTLEKTIGIITTLSAATNRSGQNIGTATNALIMYTQKNLDVFAQMSDESAKVVENFKRGTADVVDIWKVAQQEIERLKGDKAHYNSLLDLFGGSEGMEELNASLHDELEDTFEQISSVYNIANTYRKNYFIALLDNLDRFDKVQQQLQDAQGYSQEENLKYMETFEAKQNTLIAKWQYLANDEQGLLKFKKDLIELGIKALDLVKGMGGIVNTVMTLTGIIGGLVITIKSATIAKKVSEAASAFKALKTAVQGVATAGEAAQASFGWIGLAITAISLLIGGITAVSNGISRTNQEFIDQALAAKEDTKKLAELSTKLDTLDKNSDEYYEVEKQIVALLDDKEGVLGNLTEKTEEYSEAVRNLTKDELEHQLVTQKVAINAAEGELTKKVAFAQFSASQFILSLRNTLGGLEWGQSGSTILIAWDQFIKEMNEAEEKAREAAQKFGYYSKQYDDAVANYAKYEASYKDIAPYIETYTSLNKSYKTLQDTLASYNAEAVEEMNNLGETIEDVTIPDLQKLLDSIAEINEQVDSVQSNLKVLEDAQKELDETGQISIDTFQSIISLGDEYANVLEYQNGKLVINKEKLDELLKSKDSYLNQLVNEQVLAYAQTRANELLTEGQNAVAESSANAAVGVAALSDALSEATGTASNSVSKYSSLAESISKIAQETGLSSSGTSQLFNDVYSYEAKLRAALKNSTWTGTSGGGSGGSGSSSSGSTKDEYLENLKAIVSLRKSELTLMEHQGKSAEDQIKKMKEIQASLHNQAEYLREVGASETDINSLSSEWWTYQEKILKTYQETLNAAKELELEAIEKVISSIQEEIDLKEEELTLSEKQLAVTQAQADLEKAIAQAKLDFISQVLSNYITALADAETLEEKQRAVVEAKEKYATAQKEAQTKAVVDAMKAQKDLGKDALSLEEKRLAVEEARQALIDAQNDRTTRVFDEASGEWHYEANAQNIKSAQERLADAMKSLDEYLEGEAWDEMLDKMEKGSVSESEMLAIIQKWQDQGYGTTEWSEKLVQAYRFAMGATADPNSVAGELNAVNSATKALNDYLKNQAIKEIQNMIKNGNTSTAEMQIIMEKWLSMGEGGEIWQWSEGVLNEVRKAIQSNAYDGSKVESSVKAVETATKALADYFQNKFVSDINKLVAAGSAAEIYAALKYWEETGQIPDDLMDWGKRLADEVGIKNKVENDYKSIENDPSHYGEVKSVVDSGYAASMTSAALAATNPDLTSALTGVAQFGANAASWMNSYGIGYGASDKTPSESFINTRNSTTNDSHNSYTVNGVPFSADSIRGLTMQELFETLPIVTE